MTTTAGLSDMTAAEELTTARGHIVLDQMPPGLRGALMAYDRLRTQNDPETADAMAALLADRKQHAELTRLRRGLRRLSFRSVCQIATRHSHVCQVYVRDHLSTLTTMVGLFYWNDGGSTVRERLLISAWNKGYRP